MSATTGTLNAGRETDGIIATTIFGWTTEPVTYKDEIGLRWTNTDEEYSELVWHPKKVPARVRRYSEDMDSALELLDALGGEVRIARDNGAWTVRIGSNDAWWDETLPMAICRAALDAVTDSTLTVVSRASL